MKKMLLILTLFTTFFLVGCSFFGGTTTTETTTTTTTAQTTTTTTTTTAQTTTTTTTPTTTTTTNTATTLPPTTITTTTTTGDPVTKLADYTVVSKATYQQFNGTSLAVYTDTDYPDTLFVNVENFLQILHEGLKLVMISKSGSELTASYIFNPDQTVGNTKNYSLKLDSAANTLTYNDFNFNFYLSPSIDEKIGQGIEETYTTVTTGDNSKVINLNDYGIDIAQLGRDFYIPLYLADLILTGEFYDVYLAGETFYIVDDFSEITNQMGNVNIYSAEQQAVITSQSQQYLQLLMDNFYGLKQLEDVTSYHDIINSYDLFSDTTLLQFDSDFQDFVYGLNDLHSWIINYGFNDSYVLGKNPPVNSRLNQYLTARQTYGCYAGSTDAELYEDTSYYVLKVYQFSDTLNQYLASLLVGLNPDKPIYIDVSCNPGGLLSQVVVLLSYMTNKEFTIYSKNPATNTTSQDQYVNVSDKALPNTFYVYTGPVTFSAANLFASICEDQGIAVVFGQKTGGGTATITQSIFPNNLVFNYSSCITVTDSNYNYIEYGVDPMVTVTGTDIETAITEFVATYTPPS